MMRWILMAASCVAATGCTVERLGPPGVVLTRPVVVHPRAVKVFDAMAQVPGPYQLVEDVWIEDDGKLSPREMESRLRVQAGARGANAIVMDKLNRRDNGTRIVKGFRLDDPFKYYRASAIWMGNGARPETYLGTLGGTRRP